MCLPEIEYEIDDVECVIRVTHYTPEDPSVTDGPADNWYEGSPAEIEYEVLHIDGTDAPELEKLLTRDDDETIYRQALKEIKEIENE